MNPMTVPLDVQQAAVRTHALEALVCDHFDRAYMVFSAFVDDPRRCLDLTESLFRSVADAGSMRATTVYRGLVNRIRRISSPQLPMEGVGVDDVLCWLLKETTAMSYAEIAMVMDWQREAVKASIAIARAALIAAV